VSEWWRAEVVAGSVWSRCSGAEADHENNRTTAPHPFSGP
jgi:hypothetical protein